MGKRNQAPTLAWTGISTLVKTYLTQGMVQLQKREEKLFQFVADTLRPSMPNVNNENFSYVLINQLDDFVAT